MRSADCRSARRGRRGPDRPDRIGEPHVVRILYSGPTTRHSVVHEVMVAGLLCKCGCGAAADGVGAFASGGIAVNTLPAANVAARSTMPVSTYCVCALKSRPLEQTKSSSTHNSTVLPAYSGPTATSG